VVFPVKTLSVLFSNLFPYVDDHFSLSHDYKLELSYGNGNHADELEIGPRTGSG
jgi:hypothetical protein